MNKNTLTPDEVLITQIALSATIEDMEVIAKDHTIPFTPEARKSQRDMLAAAKSAHKKIAAASGQLIQLDPYKEGDETDFLTKQS